MENIILNKPLIFLDFETTGLNPECDRIVELTYLKVNPDGTKEKKSERINPVIPISSGATEVHGITDEDVKDKPTFKQYSKGLIGFFSGCDIAGYNIKRFDLPMLKAEFKRVGIDFDIEQFNVVDAMTIFHAMEPRDLSAAYKKYCGEELEDAHSSSADVTATMGILDAQVKYYSQLPNNVESLHEFCHPKQPDWIDEDGKLISTENGVAFGFGKYRDRLISEVAADDSKYLEWILTSDFSDQIKDFVRKNRSQN